MYPFRNVVKIIAISYLIVKTLAETKEFQFSPSPRQLTIHATISALNADSLCFFYDDACECGYKPIHVPIMIVRVCITKYLVE